MVKRLIFSVFRREVERLLLDVKLIDEDVKINKGTNRRFQQTNHNDLNVASISSLRTANSEVNKLTYVKSTFVVLLPMLNINSDLIILKDKLLSFLFTEILLTTSLKLSIFPFLQESLHLKLQSYLTCSKRTTKAFSKTLEAFKHNLYPFFCYYFLLLSI